jgi:hypothetical protein
MPALAHSQRRELILPILYDLPAKCKKSANGAKSL